MEPREYYVIRRAPTGEYYSGSEQGWDNDILSSARFARRESAVSVATNLQGKTDDLRKSGVLEIVHVRITVEELRVSQVPSVARRVVD